MNPDCTHAATKEQQGGQSKFRSETEKHPGSVLA
jgi:hypothetical protein